MGIGRVLAVLLYVNLAVLSFAAAQNGFINYETPHVSPIGLSPDGTLLAICNTPADRIEIYDVTTVLPQLAVSIPVGQRPVSVRFRNNTELWAVNHNSDSVSVIDLATNNVTATINTRIVPLGAMFALPDPPLDFGDEPTDVVFAGTPEMAYISCSQSNVILVVDPNDPAVGAIDYIEILGEDPRAMAVSPDGSKVYVAVFESGNKSTILQGNIVNPEPILPNVVTNTGPYGGQNPPPNDGALFNPPINPALPTPPRVSLIVKKNSSGQWLDDNNGDWTQWVSGPSAAASGRVPGWDVIDNDLAIIDTATHAVTYATGLMNICMALGVNPATGNIAVVGTDATNEIRFEPVINGRFLRVNVGIVNAANPNITSVVDLNPHLDYTSSSIPVTERVKSIGDPRGIVWNSAGTRGYVTGMGSNNVIVIDANGARVNMIPTNVKEGPTGIVLNASETHLYVLNKFHASISVIDTATDTEVANVPFFDPTPEAIKVGRKHLYDTHKNSGLGHIACASCHLDSRMDRLSWDLGDPSGEMKDHTDQNLFHGLPIGAFQPFHPMKGPMATQTLQDIIGKEPLHWRGDRRGIEEFNPAFQELQGADSMLTSQEMQEFKNFLATIHFPPNPFRNLDNSLPTSVPLFGQFSAGRFAGTSRGDDMPNGDAVRGLRIYMGTEGPIFLADPPFNCVTCHTLPLGNGGDSIFNPGTFSFQPFPVGMNNNHHSALVAVDGLTNRNIKTPHLRNGYDKIGMDLSHADTSRSGFGFLHDGSVDSLTTFLSSQVFAVQSDQDVADLVALMLAFSGSDFGDPPQNPPDFGTGTPLPEEPPSFQVSLDAHAAVGKQVTMDGPAKNLADITTYLTFADAGSVDVIAKTSQDGVERGWVYIGSNLFQPDLNTAGPVNLATVLASAAPGQEVTFTVVDPGTGVRLGIDSDGDGYYNFTEVLGGSNPFDPKSIPVQVPIRGVGLAVVTSMAVIGFGMRALSARAPRRRRW